jgi:hypothetical protein
MRVIIGVLHREKTQNADYFYPSTSLGIKTLSLSKGFYRTKFSLIGYYNRSSLAI